MATSKPRVVPTSESLDDSNGSQDQDRHEIQDGESTTRVFPELQDKVDCVIVAIETAVDNMIKENAVWFKTTAWLLDDLYWNVNSLAIAVEATAALTTPWDDIARLG
ncbi:hypothetical protein CORC01_14392 [Colletotrichum orchidophilum]|uniref:Uncharacterized protein n=1 Tax=Colletotrichum orchidophilum TaxID=1209926 RepID=A0A1G4AMJ7_9PEZI|nr:uncharacterized protein CORC01_14392 [Colletotrichum orchidophilum]OHE90305.1 hypothetical protein CORC01_14392 [Colletotrichum orchidophilum]